MSSDMKPLMDMILEKVPAPEVNIDGPLQLQISALDSNNYVGVIGIGRIKRYLSIPLFFFLSLPLIYYLGNISYFD